MLLLPSLLWLPATGHIHEGQVFWQFCAQQCTMGVVMCMRVIAGKAKGRKLVAPRGYSVRPTSDKVKGAVFNVLAQYGPIDSFLDLFAGSGAMGIEAWSRGATRVVFVEKDRIAQRALRTNLETVGLSDATVLPVDWQVALRRLDNQSFAAIYADPPFYAGLYPLILTEIGKSRLLGARGILCLEHPQRLELDIGDEWELLKTKSYGDTAVTYLTPGALGTKGGDEDEQSGLSGEF